MVPSCKPNQASQRMTASASHATSADVCSNCFPTCLSTCHGCPISRNCLSPDAVFVWCCRVRVQRRQLMRVLMRPIAAALLIAAGLLFVPAANAQVQSPSPGLSDQSPNIPDQKLGAAAAAIERVASLKQDYQQRIAAAAPSDKEHIANEAINALAKAVTDQGLSVVDYALKPKVA